MTLEMSFEMLLETIQNFLKIPIIMSQEMPLEI